MQKGKKKTPVGKLRRRLSEAFAWANSLLHRDLADASRWQRIIARNIRVFLLVARPGVLAKVKLHAQALTYVALLSIVPLFAVAFAIFKGFGATEGLVEQFTGFLLKNVSGSPEQQETLASYVMTFASNINAGQLGWVSIAILVWSVLILLGHIETAFNAIFGVNLQRPFVTRMLTYWAVLTFGPLLLAGSFALTASFQNSRFLTYIEGLGGWAAVLGIVPLLTTWVAFTIMYLVVPNTRVRVVPALLAAIIAGSAWNLGKFGYALYAKHAVTQQVIYGSLAAIPVFVLWVYVSWLLVLFGAHLCYAFQNAETYRREDERAVASLSFTERATCRVFLDVARDFLAGNHPPTIEDLAMRLRIPRRLLEALLQQMRAHHLVVNTDPDGGLIPGRDLHEVTIATLVELLRSGDGPDPALVEDAETSYFNELFSVLDDERNRIMGETTFRDLALRFASPVASNEHQQTSSHGVHH